MSDDSQSASERVREFMASLNLPLDDLVGMLHSTRSASTSTPVSPKPVSLTDVAIRAAISDSFTAKEIGATEADRDVLDQSDVVMIGGSRRLRLSDAMRGAIVQAARETERFGVILGEAIDQDAKRPPEKATEVAARSACLRRFIKGDGADFTAASADDLRAAVAARERLLDAPLSGDVPSLADLQRLLERAELLEPLRITIGATGNWDAAPTTDRFVGRTAEVTALRKFVDEIESEGTLESVQRTVSSAGQAVRRGLGDDTVEGVRFVVARGGLGKSALIAKFVLDHALRQHQAFPFAYLDFDRAAIQSRDPRQLLSEVARQVALQFPAAQQELHALRDRIRRSISGIAPAPSTDDPFEEFRALVRRRITHDQRALLIVFDTVEIVQCDPAGVQGLIAFLERLGKGGFPGLRIVVAGRALVPELIAKSPSRREGVAITLGPLSLGEAREMVRRLGTSLLQTAWKEAWTICLAGKDVDVPERREPLPLRVAVETLRDEVPEKRDQRAREIEELGEAADASFVGKLYMNRIVGHVQGGAEVRAIAWPGLVVRRVSVELIRDVLVPRLNVLLPRLKLDPARAEFMFNALAAQVWIVVRDGDILTHQPELRARTLPLMRRKTEFSSINAAAIEYFAGRRERSMQDRAEWLYHRLLGGEPPSSVDAAWDDALVPLLKDATEDFPPKSAAADYLAARTSDRLLPDDVLARVEPRIALLHIARAGLSKGNLSDLAIDPLLVTLPIASISGLTQSAAAARVTLLVKTGRWREVDDLDVDVHGTWQQQTTTAIAFRRARMISPGIKPAIGFEREVAVTETGAMDRASVATLIQDLAASRMYRWPIADRLDEAVTRQISRSPVTDAMLGVPALRTAMLFGDRATIPAARWWIQQTMEQVRANRPLACSAIELRALLPDDQLQSTVAKSLSSQGQTWEGFMKLTDDPQDRTRLDDPMVAPAVYDALSRRCERGKPDDVSALRRFAAARDEDWLVPLAYSAHRATDGRVPSKIAGLYETHRPASRGLLSRAFSHSSVPTDVLEALRRADEASDLSGALSVFLEDAKPVAAEDLRALMEWYDTWRLRIQDLLDDPSAATNRSLP